MKILTANAACRNGLLLVAGVLLAALLGCERESARETPGEPTMRIQVTSPAIGQGQPIPTEYTGDGRNISPPLAWSSLPEGTKELALIVDDPDAPRPQPWVHWVVYKIPAIATGLEQAIAPGLEVPGLAGALQGKNSSGSLGYRGPAPPKGHGVHHYHFKLYALDAELDLDAGADKLVLLAAMQGHVLSEGELVGTYRR